MSSDELLRHIKVKELHTWWYQVDVFPCGRCPLVCAYCRQMLQLPACGPLDLKEYSEQDIREVSEFVKRQGLRFNVEVFLREHEDEGDK